MSRNPLFPSFYLRRFDRDDPVLDLNAFDILQKLLGLHVLAEVLKQVPERVSSYEHLLLGLPCCQRVFTEP